IDPWRFDRQPRSITTEQAGLRPTFTGELSRTNTADSPLTMSSTRIVMWFIAPLLPVQVTLPRHRATLTPGNCPTYHRASHGEPSLSRIVRGHIAPAGRYGRAGRLRR